MLPSLPPREGRIFFFDLADPEKRAREDLLETLDVMSRFGAFGSVTLGLNLKESQRVHAELGFSPRAASENDLQAAAAEIRSHLNLHTVVVHPRESAACATPDGTFWVPGPFTRSNRSSPPARGITSTPVTCKARC